MEIMEPYDVVIDGTDNFPVRYLVNDATQFLGKPLVYGSIYQFEGPGHGVHAGPGRAVLSVPVPLAAASGHGAELRRGRRVRRAPGVIGAIQATEAIKVITGEGDSLVGRLLLYDALHMDFQEVKIRWDADCPVCGKDPSITELIDYELFCGVPAQDDRPTGDQPTMAVTVKAPHDPAASTPAEKRRWAPTAPPCPRSSPTSRPNTPASRRT
jgi:adenylyltransferase/sulfurtransferase